MSFLNSRLDTARMDSIAQQRGIRAGRGFVAAHLAAQNPVSTLPSFTVEDESTRCLFLYPGSHDRFLYSRPTAKGDSLHSLQIPMLDPRVAIPDDAWPIPILLPADTALRSAETRAQLTAVVRELPPELARKFGVLYGQHYDQRVLSNFLFLPGEPSLCYCLSVLPSDQDAGIESALPAVSPVDRALLYVEGHVSGERPDLTAIEEALALPGLGHFTQLDGSRPKAPADEQYRLLAAPFDITINLKAPNVVGLYAETTPTRDLPVRVQDLLTMWTGLRGGLEDIERRQGSPLTLSTDFMFDFDRQALFDPKGLLPPAEDEVAGESDVSDARTWLRSPGSGA
jgi:hypothetical protein